MSAKNDLDNAFSILDAGIKAHVTALKNSHAVAATAQAAANDETYITGLTAKVLAWADTLSASSSEATLLNPVATEVAVEAPVAPVLTPEVQVASQVAQVLPVAVAQREAAQAAVLPASVAHDPGATPAMIAAALAAEAAHSPAKGEKGTFAAIESALHDLISKAPR